MLTLAHLLRWLSHQLAGWADALDPPPPPVYAEPPPPPIVHTLDVPIDALYARALELVTWAESTAAQGTTGAYKRWEMVYPKLVADFPHLDHGAINRAIEAVVSLKG